MGRQSRCSGRIINNHLAFNQIQNEQPENLTLNNGIKSLESLKRLKKKNYADVHLSKRPSGHIQTKFEEDSLEEEFKFKELIGNLKDLTPKQRVKYESIYTKT